MTKITYIPGEIANAAIDEHGNRKPVTRTQHIFDDAKGKSQAKINEEFGNAIGGLNSQNYVTVDSFNALPDTGEADTVYRVSNWDGTQQDPTVYSEYAWNGSDYVHLSTKTQIGEVFDISAYHATGGTLAKYADLAAALNGGANIPQSLQKGGMSIKFVQSFDNKYVQHRCIADEFTTDITMWIICDNDVVVSKLPSKTENIDAGDYISGKLMNTDGTLRDASNYAIRIIEVPPLTTITLNNGYAFYFPGDAGGKHTAVVFTADSNGNLIETLAIGDSASHIYPPITNNTSETIYIGISATPGVTRYIKRSVVNAASQENLAAEITRALTAEQSIIANQIKDWILGESYTITGATYTDGVINSPVSVTWPDATSGTLTIVRNSDGLVTSINATHSTDTYVLTITRNSDGNATTTTIVKQ